MPLPTESIEQLIEGVYTGRYSVFELPTFLYAYTVEALDEKMLSGFGTIPKGSIKTIEKAVNFRNNLGVFSGAKTWQEVNDMSGYVFDKNGFKRPFAEFKKRALEIDEQYNVNWLRTEQDTVFTQSQNARKWIKAEEQNDVFPVLEYIVVGDDRTRPDHMALNGLRARVDDPIWNKIHPANGWNCRCTVKQHHTEQVTSKRMIKSKTKLIDKTFKKHSDFAYNPGKADMIFKEVGKGKHNYFSVPKEFKGELRNNFGFPTIEEMTGKVL